MTNQAKPEAAEGNDSLAEMYSLIFERLLPRCPQVPVRGAEVFGITPERYDPFRLGLRELLPFGYAALPSDRPYPVCGGSSCSFDSVHDGGILPQDASATVEARPRATPPEADAIQLQVYLGPIEWEGPDDAVVEAGVLINGYAAKHWVWRLGRDGPGWRVLRSEVVWSARLDQRGKPAMPFSASRSLTSPHGASFIGDTPDG